MKLWQLPKRPKPPQQPAPVAPSLADLLGRGFFPQELPPPFNSLSFGKFAKGRGKKQLPFDTSQRQTSRPAFYNLARAGSFRRELAILNPIHFALLAECIVANWETISKLTKSKLSLTLPTPRTEGRAIARLFSLDSLPLQRAKMRSEGSFILQTDIARFYPSVYTHTIPWVIHGKSFAKSNRESQHFGNKLDSLLRNCQDGQTNGIPVGPDTSLVISELLLAKIDNALTDQGMKGLRYMDDYELIFTSEERALNAKSILQEALLDLELDLSTSKTSILPLPQPLEDSWVSTLNHFDINPSTQFFDIQIIRFFDTAFELARSHPREGVLKYAAGRVTKMFIPGSSLALVEYLLMQCAQVEAGTLSFVLASMLKITAIDKATMNRRRAMLTRIIQTHAVQRHSSEVAWAIWAFIAMDLPLPKAVVRAALEMEDSICALLLLHARKCKLIEHTKDILALRPALTDEALHGPRWLLAYEANVKGWFHFHPSKDYVANDRNFKFLKKANVSFYDESKTQLHATESGNKKGKVIDDYLSRITAGYGTTVISTDTKVKVKKNEPFYDY